jgi:hypothetical protein
MIFLRMGGMCKVNFANKGIISIDDFVIFVKDCDFFQCYSDNIVFSFLQDSIIINPAYFLHVSWRKGFLTRGMLTHPWKL